MAGVELHRYGIAKRLSSLLAQTGYPFATTLLGKSILSEMHPQFIGSYAGTLSEDFVRQRVENSDCILCLGLLCLILTLVVLRLNCLKSN